MGRLASQTAVYPYFRISARAIQIMLFTVCATFFSALFPLGNEHTSHHRGHIRGCAGIVSGSGLSGLYWVWPVNGSGLQAVLAPRTNYQIRGAQGRPTAQQRRGHGNRGREMAAWYDNHDTPHGSVWRPGRIQKARMSSCRVLASAVPAAPRRVSVTRVHPMGQRRDSIAIPVGS